LPADLESLSGLPRIERLTPVLKSPGVEGGVGGFGTVEAGGTILRTLCSRRARAASYADGMI
jgi:hypothetical protein